MNVLWERVIHESNLCKEYPNHLTMMFKLKVNGPTNPRVRVSTFHFGYERRNKTLHLHGKNRTGEPFSFEFGDELDINIRIQKRKAFLTINCQEIGTVAFPIRDKRTIMPEAGGKQSESSAE